MNSTRNTHIKMDKANRAKQFMPFDALTGFREALREKERIKVTKKDLCEEKKDELDYKLKQLKEFDMVTVEYYNHEEYIRVTGVITKIDFNNRVIKIVDTNILIDDIFDLQLTEV